ncbi:MAG: DUF2953 domain-containing protein [Hydrogenoanaerobacterium sp.]
MTVFVCVVGGIILLLCIPVSLYVSFGTEQKLLLGWLCFKFDVTPKAEISEKQKKRDAKKAAKEAKKAAKAAKKGQKSDEESTKKKPKSTDDLVELLGLALDAVRAASGSVLMLIKDLRVQELTLKMTVAKQDAAETAIAYGKTSSYVYGTFALLQNYIKINNSDIDIKPDFLVDKGSFDLSFRVLITPLIALCAAVAVLFKTLGSFIKRMLAKQ